MIVITLAMSAMWCSFRLDGWRTLTPAYLAITSRSYRSTQSFTSFRRRSATMLAYPGTGPRKTAALHWRAVFDTLSDRLQGALGDLRKRGRLDDEAISRAMREVRLALLEADVNFEVVKDFVGRVRERAVGADVLKSLTPGQQVVKIVHEELTALMGAGDSKLAVAGRPPTVILRKEGRKPGLVAADLQRPAAIDQLEQLGRELQMPVFSAERADPVAAAREGLE